MVNKILQGTTPTLTISLPDVDMTKVSEIELTISQGDAPTIYHDEDVVIDRENGTITKHFTEKETLKLSPGRILRWQLRVKFADGSIAGTPISVITVTDLISEEVMP